MPKAFLNTAERQTITDNDWRYFVTFGLSWITTAIDQAFTADPTCSRATPASGCTSRRSPTRSSSRTSSPATRHTSPHGRPAG
jgi:hypothetical protein